MAEILSNTNPTPAMGRTLSLRVLGVGGAGCNAVSQLAAEALSGVEFALLNTDAAALMRQTNCRRFVLGERSVRGLGAGGEPERGRAAAEEDAGMLRELCQGSDLVFVVAGMGGGTGTGAAPVVARVAREAGALVIGVVVTPFDSEGRVRQRRAAYGLQQLQVVADAVICLPNQAILKQIDEKTSLLEAFRLANDLVAQGIQGLWRMLSRPGLINVDFADLCAVIKGKHCHSSLASAEARGENRAAVLLERLFAHPLIEGGARLSESTHMLVCLVGGPELSMRDVNHVMEQIRRHAEHASIVLGACIEDESRDRIAITVVASTSETDGDRRDASSPEPGVVVDFGPAASSKPSDEPLLREENLEENVKVPSRFVAPPPESTPEMVRHVASQTQLKGRRRSDTWKQGTLNLEIVSKGRFEKSAPTIHRGQDLDIPTFVRRGVVLN
ncbi:MAG: cell division protein FtsZ [Verrucomicrobia bacterium]|nr:cell division protein FtsZ [Verrucomicrobiota bacterium]MBI3867738.1 cell division protein FtsZ [Verrucomicrobiota bacterium]